MSKRKGKSDKFTEIREAVGYLPSTGEGGDECIDVCVRHFVEVTIDGNKYPTELNAWEARKLGEALIKAGRQLDGRR